MDERLPSTCSQDVTTQKCSAFVCLYERGSGAPLLMTRLHFIAEFKSLVNINWVVEVLFHWSCDCSHCPLLETLLDQCQTFATLDKNGRAPPWWFSESSDHAAPTEGMLLPTRFRLPLEALQMQMNPCALRSAVTIAWPLLLFFRGAGREDRGASDSFRECICWADLYHARRLWPQCRTRFHLETRGASKDFRHNCNCLSKKKKKKKKTFALSSFSRGAFFCHTLQSCESVLGPPAARQIEFLL